jgi:hypothetical protein
VSLKHGLAMSGQRGVMVQNKQGWVYPGHDWPNGTDGRGMSLNEPKEREDLQ